MDFKDLWNARRMIVLRVADKRIDNTPRGRLRALYERLTGAASVLSSSDGGGTDRTRPGAAMPSRIGHYAIERKLGEGGMGVVYAARDERLERNVALKTMSSVARDATARERFWREARSAASVNHPNICQIYEIGEEGGELFIAMELLEGEVLSDRLQRGPLGPPAALPIGLEILTALAALHARGIVHRDLKPSNVFLTAHGVKLLDFGLARPDVDDDLTRMDLTRPGIMLGTPRYMAPEQVSGAPVDARSDLFSAGTILFEMLAGRPAFAGRTVAEILHATRYEQPPALTGSPAVAAVDRVIRRALAKRPDDRPPSADAMAVELRGVGGLDAGDTPALAHTLTRLVVLPFRVLRPDPETDFLAFSLPDAISTSLSGISSLVVRSNAVAARFAGETPDLKALAADADVDRVVMGTLLRSGDQLRATAQLVEAPGGTLLSAQTVQSSMGDLFRLQDDISRRIVEALSLPLSGGPLPTPQPRPDGRAYELYLRANELARAYDGLAAARDLYLRCVELDPQFAAAWARLGRCYRVIGKYIDGAPDSESRAEEAFRRALALEPTSRWPTSSTRTSKRTSARRSGRSCACSARPTATATMPELFAGLVHACRYCGLYEQSIAAHVEARRLDPNVPTSLDQTLMMTGDIDRLIALEPPAVLAGADDGIRVIGLGLAGRREEAQQRLADMRHASRLPIFHSWIEYLTAWLERRPAEMLVRMSATVSLKIQDDPEAIFQQGWLLCDVGEHEAGLVDLRRAVQKGYFVAATLAERPQFDALRGTRRSRRCSRKRRPAAPAPWRRSRRRAANGCSAP